MEVMSGFKSTDVGVIPEDWDVKSLLSLVEHKKELLDDGDWIEAEYLTDKGVRLIQTGNIGEGIFTDKDVKKYISEESFRKLRCKGLQIGDILICRLAEPAGRACLLPDIGEERMITAVDVTIFRPPAVLADRRFLVGVFTTPRWFGTVADRCGGSTRTRISRGELGKISVPLPPLAEQRVIAAALSDVDALLDELDRLIAKKRYLKQAVMQQLLTGKARLPGYSASWEVTQVQDVISGSFCGPSPTCDERNLQDDSEWGVLKTTAATKEKGWDWTKHKTLPRAFWNKPQLEVKKGDVIVTKAGPRHRVGVTAWVDYVPPQIIVSGKMIGLRPRPNRVLPLMLAAAISAPGCQSYLDQRTTGMAESQVNFENTALLEAPIRIPRIDEQIAIATVLSDVDRELAALEARRNKTRALKQAMMQELLTGRTRLV
jgi:type I restriction enzyme S subunit